MSRYGSNFYSDIGSALTYYGESSGVVFDTSPFLARPTNYGEVTLTWTRPATGSSLSLLRLVRNTYGHPESPIDGSVLFDMSINDSPTKWVDSGLSEGIFYYYTLYATDPTGAWGFAGTAETYSARRWGLSENMWDLIPTFMKTQYTFDASGVENEAMKRWVSLYGFELDCVRTEVELLGKSHDVNYMKHSLIPLGLAQYGMTYEPSIGVANNRKLLRNAGEIVSLRGTRASVENYISSITGWGVEARIGSNIMLNHNDSSFEEGPGPLVTPLPGLFVGNWNSKNRVTLTRELTGAIPAYLEPASPSNFPNRTAAYMAMVVPAGTGTPIAELPQASQIKTRGIPVNETTYYVSNCRLRRAGGSATKTITMTIVWYNASGAEISRTVGTPVSVASSADWDALAVTSGTSPSLAVWAGLELSIDSGSTGNSFFVDAVQFGKELDDSGVYQDARLVDIRLYPNRQNYIETPCFRLGSTGNWTTSVGTLTVSATEGVVSPKSLTTTVAVATPVFTTNVGTLYASSGWGSGLWDDGVWDDIAPGTYTGYDSGLMDGGNMNDDEFVSIPGGGSPIYPPANQVKTYTTSAYVKVMGGTLTGPVNITLSQIWIDGLTHTSVTPVAVGVWTRVSLTSQNTGTGFYRVSVGVSGGSGGTTLMHIDGIMLERSTYALEYFDGGSRYSSYEDGMWFGTPYASESLLYINRLPKFTRLRASVKNYLPEAADFRLSFAKLLLT